MNMEAWACCSRAKHKEKTGYCLIINAENPRDGVKRHGGNIEHQKLWKMAVDVRLMRHNYKICR